VKLAVVVQRYGLEINGGAELHARYVAEHLARHAEVEVLTTCARDYVTWRNEVRAGEELVNGIRVHRFPVSRERSPEEFGRRSQHVFERTHSLADELAWLDSEGPTSPGLVAHLARHGGHYDYLIFFSYRYYHTYHGIRAAASRSLLVPTAERDGAIGLSMFGAIFRGTRALMYNSHEERAMIEAASGNTGSTHVIVGVGSDVPERTDPARFRGKFAIASRYVVYVGRIDENKGCKELFSYFQQYARGVPGDLTLVLIGNSILPIPDDPRIRHLGFLPDTDKFDAIAGAEALIMPSYFESLSMVALEAWALGRPVLANGRCDVLRGQCIRSNAGLYYETFQEFVETLYAIESNRGLNRALGENGRAFFATHYAWPVIEAKYMDVLHRLQADDRAGKPVAPIDPIPGWLARRRASLPPAVAVLRGHPEGPVIPGGRRS
jgi:glycosyltransferase involved in cell wall biosynthesis